MGAGNAVADDFVPGVVSSNGTITVPRVDYRKDWAFLGTYTADGGKGIGFHSVYSQRETVAHYRKTGVFPDGAVLVKELYDTKSGDLTTGAVRWASGLVGWFVMVKDSKGRFGENLLWGDGWGWAFFKADAPDKTTTKDYKTECLACHEPVRATDLSYTQGYPTLKGPGR
ncbi:MAG: hypothetical protein GKS00_22010 [Alphaproteobacteria bacterium]|nr:hypothetical protein [Alphaproteobacteria bacterium]